MKKSSVIVKLVVIGVLGASSMVGCGDDNGTSADTYDENGCRDVENQETFEYEQVCDGVCEEIFDVETEDYYVECHAPSEDGFPPTSDDLTTTTSEDPTTTVEETTTTTTTTTIGQTTTTVKRSTPTTTRPAGTAAPLGTVAPTTQAPVTAPPTQAPTTAPPTTLPPVNVSYMWSGASSGCNVPYNTFDLMVDVMGATSAGTISVSVNGQTVSSYGGSTFNVGDTMYILFDQWPSLANGTYSVTITASSETQGPTTLSTSVTYNCPP